MRLFSLVCLFFLTCVVSAATTTTYIVVLKPDTSSDVLTSLVQSILGIALKPLQKFTAGSFSGFAVPMTATQAKLLSLNPNVEYVEEDGVLIADGALSLKPTPRQKRTMLTQSPGIWGLGRVSHKSKGIKNYVYDDTAGSGTCIYIIDTGINIAHKDFGGRAKFLQNWVTGESSDDLLGHGTAVAGTAGSTTYGVAKKTTLYSLKACDQNGNCDVSNVVSAIAFATSDSKKRSCPKGVVINLSLGGLSAGWQSVRDSVVAATQAGIFVVAAAGNDYANTQSYLPASAPGACAVGATDSNDAIASFSNWGSTVAVFAPGVSVQSTYIGSTTATASFDGTSMSAPHVAGLGAYLNSKNGIQSPIALCNTIKSTANANMITGLGGLTGTPNKLAYNGAA